MGTSLSIPALRLGLWPLMEQVIVISACGLLVTVILNNFVEPRRRKLIDQEYYVGRIQASHKSRSLVSGYMSGSDAAPDLEGGMTVSGTSNEIDESESVARSSATPLTNNCASKARSRRDSSNSMSQLVSEMDVLEMIPAMDTPNTVVSGFWHDAEEQTSPKLPTSPAVSVVSGRNAVINLSVVTSRSVLTGKHTTPAINLSRRSPEAKPSGPTMIPLEVCIPDKMNPIDENIQSTIDSFQERALQADRMELLEIGESLFVVGEMLQVNGRREEALQVLQRAEYVQKRAVEEIIEQIAHAMRREGVKLRDRGNVPHLAMTLLGAAELLTACPTAANLRACSRVHIDYKSNFIKQRDMRDLVIELDEIFNVVSENASALAQTLRAQAGCHRQARQ